jgi:hypothetical protein
VNAGFAPWVTRPLILRKTPIEHLKFHVKEIAGRVGVDIHGWRGQRQNYNAKRANRFSKYQVAQRLSGDTLDAVVAQSEDYLTTYKNELDAIPENSLHLSTQHEIVPVIDHLLRTDDSARTIIDVGSHYAKIYRSLCRDHPDVAWHGIDFPANLETVNADIKTENMTFHVGYPLEWIEATDLAIDIASFNRIFCVVTADEVRRYLKALRRKARFVVFAEAAKIVFHPSNLNIDEIDADESFQMPSWRIHNYRALFEQEGYTLIHYDAVRTSTVYSGDLHFIIRGIAVPEGVATGENTN